MTCGTLPVASEPRVASTIEVEKKVFLTAQQREKLIASLPAGKSKSFWDVYYDGPAFQLTKNDWWLRQRDGAWELKIPVSFGQGLNTCQSYEEIEDPEKILRRLVHAGMLSDNPPMPQELAAASALVAGPAVSVDECVATVEEEKVDESSSACSRSVARLEEALNARSWSPFCRLHTQRTSLVARGAGHAAGRVMLDMDVVTFDPAHAEPTANFSKDSVERPYVIAEVEIMVPKGAEAEAVGICEDFLDDHGLGGAPRAYSKVLEYLLRFRPRHLDALADAGGVVVEGLEELRLLAADVVPPAAAQ